MKYENEVLVVMEELSYRLIMPCVWERENVINCMYIKLDRCNYWLNWNIRTLFIGALSQLLRDIKLLLTHIFILEAKKMEENAHPAVQRKM